MTAANSQGEGEPLECFIPVCARPSNPVPEKPCTPKIKDQDKKWVKLEWFVPSDANVKYYIIEQQEEFMVPKVEEEPEEAPAAAAPATEGEGGEEGGEKKPPAEQPTQSLQTPQTRPALKSLFSGEFQVRINFLNFVGARRYLLYCITCAICP